MFTYETTDQKEVRRFRIAQFNGRMATVKSDEGTITGFVRSVQEREQSFPQRWAITIVPNQRQQTRSAAPRVRPFAEDYA